MVQDKVTENKSDDDDKLPKIKKEHNKQLRIFLFNFVVVFLLGNIIIGMLEGLNDSVIHPYLFKQNSLRIYALSDFLHYFIGISYTIFSFVVLYQTTINLFRKVIFIKTIYITYFISIVLFLTFFHSCSPIAYASYILYKKMI